MPLPFGQGVGFTFGQEIGNRHVKRVFVVVQAVILRDGVAAGVSDIFQHILAERAFHIRR